MTTAHLPKPRKNAGASRDSEATRARILEAAQVHFSRNSFEGVGLRDLACDASVDPALVIRYFGSKEGLFREVASQAFGTEDFLQPPLSEMPMRVAALLLGPANQEAWRSGYNPLRVLLCSIGSPVAGPILAEYLDRDFIEPLAMAMRGEQADERGVALAAQILGFALIRVALDEREGAAARLNALHPLLLNSLEGLVEGQR
ncbi:TetR/AcrR family transcriptional regulator [Luteibacter anthropi]|uniref:TetR/AcrR family transcriptional regulator n=1 Tax=Luteibacter anthropi TaxID=564369 RepID=A0A7X5UAJ3_9GAMM|nr:TetR/AcrR family transcriptional regulator [Luteibacter anthropi]NII06928.1 TetR/AcrR family transcriptional regulator [Luteibacter anthropi]